jgi:hypothetical protein
MTPQPAAYGASQKTLTDPAQYYDASYLTEAGIN